MKKKKTVFQNADENPGRSKMKMRRVDTCRVIILTSIVWFFLDILLIFYFIDCNRSPVAVSLDADKLPPTTSGPHETENPKVPGKVEGVVA